jgi:hypothetical protein
MLWKRIARQTTRMQENDEVGREKDDHGALIYSNRRERKVEAGVSRW